MVGWGRTDNSNGKSRSLRDDKQKNKQRQKWLEAGDVVAAVYEGYFAGDGGGEGGAEEDGGVAYLELVYVAVEWSALFYGGEDFGEVSDAAGGEGLDGAGGDGVDADVFGAEGDGEVADSSFKCCFRYSHYVIVGKGFSGPVVSEGEDGAAVGHERGCAAGEGDEGVGADVVGDAEVVAGGEDEVVLDGIGGSEGYGVDEDVELAVGGL